MGTVCQESGLCLGSAAQGGETHDLQLWLSGSLPSSGSQVPFWGWGWSCARVEVSLPSTVPPPPSPPPRPAPGT